MWGFTVRGSWRSNITAIFWPQTYGRHVVSFLFFWCSTRALGSTLLGAGFLYCILSASSLDPNSSGPQAPSAWCGFPYHISLQLACNSTGTSNSTELYNRRPLDLWNRMSTLFRCISLWVYHGNFFSSSHFISQFPPTRFPLITAIRMCHLLPVHDLGMAFLAGSKGQNTTKPFVLEQQSPTCICIVHLNMYMYLWIDIIMIMVTVFV